MAVISQHFIIIFNKNVLKNLKLVVSLVIRKNIYKMNNHSESLESIVVIYLRKTCLIRIQMSCTILSVAKKYMQTKS